MNSEPKKSILKKRYVVFMLIVVAALSGASVAFLVNIFEKKQDAKNLFYKIVEITDEIDDPAVWGKNFPHQYDTYLKTVDQVRTRYGGSEAVPHEPSSADPRSVVSQQKLEEDARLKMMWAGYAFSKDFREERGHSYMFTDQLYTQRQVVVKQPGTCLNCHASTYLAMKKLGDGDIIKGFEEMNKLSYHEAASFVKHAVACIDCHTPGDMQLRVTRPGFIEGIAAYKKHNGIENYDVNKQATRQEMRTFVCAQCHVEYYFKGQDKRLTFPWAEGLKADEILSYYDKNPHKDFIHAETGAEVLKAQHPEFELYSQGIHAKAGVSCTDCHMPYKRIGAMKVTDHQVKSPLLSINRACQTCHNVPEQEILERVETIQTRHFEMRNRSMDALMELISDLKPYKEDVSKDELLMKARDAQKRAQFLVDFIEAENSTGFHAPQEAARIFTLSLDYVRKGQRSLFEYKSKLGNPIMAPVIKK